jgi:hypothetical protein
VKLALVTERGPYVECNAFRCIPDYLRLDLFLVTSSDKLGVVGVDYTYLTFRGRAALFIGGRLVSNFLLS